MRQRNPLHQQLKSLSRAEGRRRVIACVIACEGVNTENLYETMLAERCAELNKVAQQRDELAEALRKIGGGPHENEQYGGPVFAQIARAALAKVQS